MLWVICGAILAVGLIAIAISYLALVIGFYVHDLRAEDPDDMWIW